MKATKPCPYPYYEVIVNRTCAYLIVEGITYRVEESGWKVTTKNPVGRPEHNWQDFCSLRIIQQIYFEILDEHHRGKAEVISIDHLRRIKSGEIPF